MFRFHNRHALVTGAASGIGRAIAERLAAEGARLLLVDCDAAALEDLPLDADKMVGDVADEAMWGNGFSKKLATIDLAVINAGVAGSGTITDMTLDEWRRILRVNLDGAFLSLRGAMRGMAGRGGSIVATASAAGLKPEMGVGAYGASKAGLLHLVRVAAKEGAADRIRVNAIAPAGVETPVWDQVPMFAERAAEVGRDAAFAELASMATPLGRYAKPEEVAGQIAYLLSDEAAMVTGSTLVADGGYTL